MTDTDTAWSALLDLGVSEETLQIVTSGWGHTLTTLERVLFAHTGFSSFDQLDDDDQFDLTCTCGPNHDECFVECACECHD